MGSEENIKKDEENSPKNPPSPPEANFTYTSLEFNTMSNQPTIQHTSEGLELILNAQNKVMAELNDAIVRLAGTMMRGRGGKTTHRQRKARARAGEDGKSTDRHQRGHPYQRGNRGRGRGGLNTHSPNTHTHTTHTPDLLSFTPVNWHDTSFDTSGSSQFSEHRLLTGAPGNQTNPTPTPKNPAVTAYAPANAGSHASSHAANNTGHNTQPTPSTSHSSAMHPSTNVVTGTQDTLAVLAAETQVRNTEDTVDYGKDYEMDGAEGQGATAGHV
ncbi:hypothetical protein FRC12_022602 [Ceratobasidium sp. 428]|nr:hypothetical protein FRC12_022602 [Ceratobasidium sp. 428]